MDKKGGDGGSCFVVRGVTNTTEVKYVEVTGTRQLGDLLAERERGQGQSLDCAQMNKKELAEQAEGNVKESEF